MDELIRKQDAIAAVNDVLAEYIPTFKPWQERIPLDCALKIKALPPVQPEILASGEGELNVPDTNVGDMISRQAAMERLMAQNVIMDGSEYHNGFNAGVNRAQEVIRNLPPVQPKNGTLIIPLNESDFKSVKRIMLDNKPWCRMFYEEGGEAHWIKKYTPDDGEVYECDNCGVTWQFNDGGPEENEAFYCPKCGFKMVPEGEQHETD